MKFDAGCFLQQLQFTMTGIGFVREKEIPLENVHLASSGAPLTTTLTTNPGFILNDTNIAVLGWAADKVVAAGMRFKVPGDYDEQDDKLVLWLKAKMNGATNTTTAITAAVYSATDGTTDLAPDQTADLTAAYSWVKLDLSGNSLAANDVLQIVLTPEAHDTDAISVVSAVVRYKADLVMYAHDERGAPTDSPS